MQDFASACSLATAVEILRGSELLWGEGDGPSLDLGDIVPLDDLGREGLEGEGGGEGAPDGVEVRSQRVRLCGQRGQSVWAGGRASGSVSVVRVRSRVGSLEETGASGTAGQTQMDAPWRAERQSRANVAAA